MRKSVIVAALMTVSTVAFAQVQGGAVQAGGSTQIQGNTNINAVGVNTNAVAIGKGNTASNAIGAIGKGTQIKGNTNINAVGVNTNAVAIGKGNKATNEIGSIGK
jgi:hypothetical protein